MNRDGWRCCAIVDGARCEATRDLDVHHLDEGTSVLVPDDRLTTVCRRHRSRLRSHAV